MATLTVIVVGCRSARPDSESVCSGYLVTSPGGTLLVDCGPGVAVELARRGHVGSLTGVVITHAHPDHLHDLVPLAFQRLLATDGLPSIPLWLPEESRDVIGALDDITAVPTDPRVGRPLDTAFDLRTLRRDGRTTIEPLPSVQLTAHPARHAVPSAALRFTDGRSCLAFSSDTGWCEGVLAAAAGADLFFCEATYVQADRQALEEHGHLTASLAGELASAAAVEHLVLTHMLDAKLAEQTLSAGRETAAGVPRVSLAVPGMRLSVGELAD